ncbi:MAG: hypothetical protein FWC57_06505, partial [Endomicrobia bacterium]|nr:hypothetical protein [Endomicrobiia bacterium]
VRYYDVDTKKANKAFDDFMAGNITIDQYAQIISGVNEGRGDILNRAMALSARIDALVAKKRAAGYEVSEDEIKESKKFVDNILFAQQDYVLSAINNLSLWSGTVSNLKKEDLLNFINGNKEDTAGDNTGGAGKGTMIISTDGVRSISQEGVESYINSLAALAVVTEELNKLYDKVYGNTPECAAAKEQRNEYVVSKIEEKQNEINKSFINAINNTIKQASKDANGQPVQVTGNYLENIRNIAKAGDDIMNAMLKLAESFSGDSADRIRDIGYTAKLASMGITVDSGTITQKGVDENGNVIEREMKYKDTGIDAKIREIIAVSGWDAAFDFLKSNNLLI